MDLIDYIGMMKRRKKIIIFITFISFLVALNTSYKQKTVYKARTTLAVPMKDVAQSTLKSQNPSYERLIQTQILLLQSRPFAERVAKEEKISLSPERLQKMVIVQPHSSASFAFTIEVTDISRKRAVKIANAYASTCIRFNEEMEDEGRAETIRFIERQLTEYQKQISTLGAQIDAAVRKSQVQANTLSPEDLKRLPPGRISVKMETLAKWESLLNAYNSLSERRDELRLEQKSGEGNILQVVEPAKVAFPVRRNHAQDGLMGLIAGFILGIGAASILEYLDETLRTTAEIEKYFKAPVLGNVVVTKKDIKSENHSIAFCKKPESTYSELYRVLRTNLNAFTEDKEVKSYLIVNTLDNQAESAVIANLSVSLAKTQKKVVAVCANLRKPLLNEFFKVSAGPGLADWLAGDFSVKDIIKETDIKGLYIIPPGHLPKSPSELLESKKMRDLIIHLRSLFDIVVCDAPSLAIASDALILAQKTDAVLFLTQLGKTTKTQAEDIIDLFQKVNAHILGVVTLNFDENEF